MKFEYPSPALAECPYHLYKQARQECPVVKVADIDAYFVTRYEDVVFVAQNPAMFSSLGRSIGTHPTDARLTKSGVEVRSLLESDPPTHTEHRKIATRNLNIKSFRECGPMILRHVNGLIDAFIDKGNCDFIAEFAEPLPALVIAELMGFSPEFVDQLRIWGQIETQGIMFFDAERKQRQLDTLETLKAFVADQLTQRSVTPTDDVLGQLVQDQIARDGEFDLEYLQAQAIILVVGGLITTAHLIGIMMQMLLQHPDQLAAVKADTRLIANAIEETLRLESPVQWVPRRVAADVEIGGQRVTAGQHILIGMGSANRDEARFEDPEAFDIFRKDRAQHVAFGRGAHFCVGAPLAKLEATIGFEQLLARLAGLRLAADNDFQHIDSPAFRGLRRLNLLFEKA